MTQRLTPNREFIADGIMGGVSTGALTTEIRDGREANRLCGKVSLENNGGFLQMAFSAFKAHRHDLAFDTTHLCRVGVVGVGPELHADISVAEVWFYE